jgi:uncharacterized protein (TIGR03435 family)
VRDALLLIALLIPALVVNAQNAGNVPAFEVVSIKVRTERGGGPQSSPDRYNRFNVSLRGIIQDAYGLQPFEIVGGPEWVTGSVRFDVMAKASSVPSRVDMRLMVQQMLRERFALRTHMEKREMPVYLLRLSREDGRLGAKLTTTKVDCAVVECRPSMIARPGSAGAVKLLYKANGVSSSELARWLAPYVGRAVIDRTGLTGDFDIDLAFDLEGSSATSELVPVFAALPEQLGLKLDPGRENGRRAGDRQRGHAHARLAGSL